MRVKEFDDLGGGLVVWAKCGCMIMAARLIFLDNDTNNEVRRYLKKGAKVELFKTNAAFGRRFPNGFPKCSKHQQQEVKYLEAKQKEAVEKRLAVALTE